MEGLPFLPGNSFSDPTKSRHHMGHTLNYKNGYSVPKAVITHGAGGGKLHSNQINQTDLDELANFQPTLTYGQTKQAPPADFVPGHVGWDKKVLLFNGYFKQTVIESPEEHFRVRPVKVFYYLEDDSIAVVEPPVENSGIPQGKLIKRQRLPKNDQGDHWTWKDLNVGKNVTFYGRVFHLTDCDNWTREFLESEGIEVNPSEANPQDPYSQRRIERSSLKTYVTPSAYDGTRQFLEMDKKVLRFFCVWDDRDKMFGEMRPFIIHYYLVDDTLEIREAPQQNSGRDPFPILIGRHKVPKDRYNVPCSFPSSTMELSEHEIKDYFTPKDFAIGKTNHIYGRSILVYDMDNFTKAFYHKHFGITDFQPIDVRGPAKSALKMEIPEYNNYGSLEDSLQSCLSLIPKPPKKDFVKILENDGKLLRFKAILTTCNKDDNQRVFIFSYRLSDDTITIFEPPVRNSGIISGKFLEATRIPKPGSTSNHPVYYGPQDFYIGAPVIVNNQRFVIDNADLFVLKYMEEHRDQFPLNAINELRNRINETGGENGHDSALQILRGSRDLSTVVREVQAQIRRLGITDKSRVDEMYRRVKLDRAEHIDKEKLRLLCQGMHLPCDDSIIDELLMGFRPTGPNGQITLSDFRRFIEGGA